MVRTFFVYFPFLVFALTLPAFVLPAARALKLGTRAQALAAMFLLLCFSKFLCFGDISVVDILADLNRERETQVSQIRCYPVESISASCKMPCGIMGWSESVQRNLHLVDLYSLEHIYYVLVEKISVSDYLRFIIDFLLSSNSHKSC